MKYFLLSLMILVLGTTAASAADLPKANCNGNLEAQFIGQVKNYYFSSAEAGNVEHTTYDIGNFSFFSANQLCPLPLSIAQRANIWVQGYVNLNDGDPVSGVLIYSPKFDEFSID
jgi:hypothetical protein